MKRRGYGPYTPIWQIVVADILAAALVVGGWWVCRQASIKLEAARFEKEYAEKAAAAEAIAANQLQSTAEINLSEGSESEEEGSAEGATSVPVEEIVETEPDTRTEWQKKFEEYFTDEIIQTENSYSSPNVSINISHGEISENGKTSVYYVADIHVSSIDCISSYFARGQTYPQRTDLMPRMFSESNALVAINGDYCGLNFGCLVLRNGILIKETPSTSDIFILFYDGSVECMNYTDYHAEDYTDRPIYQIWCFGPSMMNAEGHALLESEMTLPSYLAGTNPRTGIGYFEPGHYCFVVVDGRQSGYSEGITVGTFATIFESLGCKCAYNLDGGGSSSLMYNGDFVNKPSSYGERDMPDIILVREPADTQSVSDPEVQQ